MTQTLFDGPDLTASDAVRLSGQLERVRNQMADGRWYTLSCLSVLVNGSEAGISARLRDMRKPRFGSHTIERERVAPGSGLYRYRLVKESR